MDIIYYDFAPTVYVLTILDDFDKDGEYYAYCHALNYKEKGYDDRVLKNNFTNFLREKFNKKR